LDLVARWRTTGRAIATSFQQPDCSILLHRRLNVGRNLPNEDFPGLQTFYAPGALDEFQPIETHPRIKERIMMKPSTDDKTRGNLHEVKGAIKQKAGELTENPNLEADGRAEKNDGKVQKAVGKIEKAVGE
jgi:uncharacterized protein YjbJ (UPF0337 family)